MWSDVFLIAIVGALVFAASEFFLPTIFPGAQLVRSQIHFYSIILTVFSLVMTSTLKTSFEIRHKIAAVEKVFTSMADPQLKEHFQNIFSNYHEHFQQASRLSLLAPWVNEVIVSLSKDMDQVAVSLPLSTAKNKLFELHQSANRYIISTHVGPLDRYDDQRYKEADLYASHRGIPVVRFYIFDGDEITIEDPNKRNELVQAYIQDQDDMTLNDFNTEVSRLHQEMDNILSIVITRDKLTARERRNLLMVDGKLFVETWDDDDTVRATGEIKAIDETRVFLRRLMAINVPEKYVHCMNDRDIRIRFAHHHPTTTGPGQSTEPLAKALARRLLQ